jgi:hypothetical protein
MASRKPSAFRGAFFRDDGDAMLRRLLLSRLIDLVVVVIGVSIIVFLMIRLIPGDAVAIMLGANSEVTPEAMAELRARVGLDQPLLVQYMRWASAALHGDLGTSLWTGHPVGEEILANIWPTLELTSPSSSAPASPCRSAASWRSIAAAQPISPCGSRRSSASPSRPSGSASC